MDNLNYSKCGKNYNFNKYSLPTVLLKNLYDGSLTRQDADMEESMPAEEPTKKCKKEVKYPKEGKKEEGKKCLML